MAKSKRGFGSIVKRGRNRYSLRWTDKQGKRRSEEFAGTLSAAEMRMSEIQTGLHGGGDAITVAGYWEQSVVPSMDNLAAKTRNEYMRLWEHDVAPAIGGIKLREIEWRDVQAMVDGIQSPSVQRHAAQLANKILGMAYRDRQLMQPIPSKFSFKRQISADKAHIDANMVTDYINAVIPLKYAPALLCELGGGLRPEEACALAWEDVEPLELDGKTYAKVRIDKTIITTKGGKLLQRFTKTEGSTRTAIIGEPFASAILARKRSGWVLQGRDGEPTAPSSVTHNLRAWSQRNGVHYYTQEDLRHCWATLQSEAGSIDSVVSLAMGHGGKSTKEKFYQAATLKSLAQIADNLENLICNV